MKSLSKPRCCLLAFLARALLCSSLALARRLRAAAAAAAAELGVVRVVVVHGDALSVALHGPQGGGEHLFQLSWPNFRAKSRRGFM